MPGGNQLYGGTLADFDSTDNMAKEIENAFATVRLSAGINDPLPKGANANDMRMMFIAIATGVINHLKNNSAALAVEVQGNLVTQVQGDVLTSDGNVTSVSVF
jgi:hypothetical protein